MTKRIKRCPFCGSKAEVIIFNYEYGTVTIGCANEDCDITMGKGFFSDEEAIEHWNRRFSKKTPSMPEIIFKHCDDMEHLIIYKGGFVESDECEGYPNLTALDVLRCMYKHNLISLEEINEYNE